MAKKKAKRKVTAAGKKAAKKKTKTTKAAKADDGLLKHAVSYVKKSGGIEKAKAVLAELEAILEAIIP
jgi:hypothetical protein